MGLDDTGAETLRRLLIAMMALLLTYEVRDDTLDSVEQVEQGIAEKLGEDERTDGQPELATVQTLYLRRIGNRALFQAGSGGIEDGFRSLRGEQVPGLARDELLEVGADTAGQVALQEAHVATQRGRSEFIAPLLHGGKINIGQHDLVGGAGKLAQRYFGTGTRSEHDGAARGCERTIA